MFTKFNKQSDFNGLIGNVSINNEEVFLIVRSTVDQIHDEFGVICEEEFVIDFTGYITSLFKIDFMESKLVLNDINDSINRCDDLSQLRFDIDQQDDLALNINTKLASSSYDFPVASTRMVSMVDQFFSATVNNLNIMDEHVFRCLNDFTHTFEKTYGVVAPENFINDFFYVFSRYDVWPNELLKHFTEKLENTLVMMDLKFDLVEAHQVHGTNHMISEINSKLKRNEYTFVEIEVYYDACPIFDSEKGMFGVQEMHPYSGTSNTRAGDIVFSSNDFEECERIANGLNNGTISIEDINPTISIDAVINLDFEL